MRLLPLEAAEVGGTEFPPDELLTLPATAMTLQGVADRLGASPRHVQNLVDAGELIATDIGLGDARNRWRVIEEDFQGFLIRNRSKARKAQAFDEPASQRRRPAPKPGDPPPRKPKFSELRAAGKLTRPAPRPRAGTPSK